MDIDKFGTITEKDGVMNVDGFDFSGAGNNIDALLAIKKYISDKIDSAISEHVDNKYKDFEIEVNKPDQMLKLNGIAKIINELNKG